MTGGIDDRKVSKRMKREVYIDMLIDMKAMTLTKLTRCRELETAAELKML